MASKPPLFEILEKRPAGWPEFVPYALHNDLITLKGLIYFLFINYGYKFLFLFYLVQRKFPKSMFFSLN